MGVVPTSVVFCSGPDQNSNTDFGAPISFTPDGFSERISDGLGKGQPHEAVHRKLTWSSNAVSGYTYPTTTPANGMATYGGSGGGVNPLLLAYNHMAPLRAFDVSSNALPPGWTMDMTGINEAAMKQQVIQFSRQLKADVLLNLVEANQVWPSIRSLTLALPAMARHWKELRRLIKVASGSYLAWKFGVSPILQDLMNIHRYLPRLVSDLRRHDSGDKSRFSIYASPVAKFSYTPTSQVLNGIETYRFDRQGRLTSSPVIRYVLVVKPKTSYGSSFFSKLDFMMSRFASSPASLAWELVPFSFVIDWFVDLRGVLGLIDNAIGYSPYQVVSFTRSFSYSCASDGIATRKHICSGAQMSRGSEGTCEYKHYERSLVPYLGSSLAWNPRFGKNQAGISAALIAQQLTRLGAKR